jgi:hypothetical protein
MIFPLGFFTRDLSSPTKVAFLSEIWGQGHHRKRPKSALHYKQQDKCLACQKKFANEFFVGSKALKK